MKYGISNNKLIDFLDYRIESEEYRGLHLLQHNRISVEKIKQLYEAFKLSCGKYNTIEIPPGDEWTANNKKGFIISEYPEFENLIKNFKKLTKQGTPNSMKKNLLPDFARLNIINRYDHKNILLDPFEKGKPKYFKFEDKFLKYTNECQNESNIEKFVNENIKLLFSDWINIIFDTILELKYLSTYEFMYFITWTGKKINEDTYCLDNIIEIIKQYRELTNSQKILLNEEIDKKCSEMSKNAKNKKYKRDYHNWKNESQEIFDAFKTFSLFRVEKKTGDDRIVLKINNAEDKKVYTRSAAEKKFYFQKHGIEKNDSYELDHVVPFSLITDMQSYIHIDNWKNMLYIDANTHRKKSNNRNKFIYLQKQDLNNLIMNSADGEFLALSNNKNMLINCELLDTIIEHNQMIVKTYNL